MTRHWQKQPDGYALLRCPACKQDNVYLCRTGEPLRPVDCAVCDASIERAIPCLGVRSGVGFTRQQLDEITAVYLTKFGPIDPDLRAPPLHDFG